MIVDDFTWTLASGVNLDTWIRGWEERVGGRVADQWTALWDTWDWDYRFEYFSRELTDRAAALEFLLHDWEAQAISMSAGPEGLSISVNQYGRGPAIPPSSKDLAISCRVKASWSQPWSPDGLRVTATPESPRAFAQWLAHLAEFMWHHGLVDENRYGGPAYAAPVQVSIRGFQKKSFGLLVGTPFGSSWKCDAEFESFAAHAHAVPELARVAHREVSSLDELASWLNDVGIAFTGKSIGFSARGPLSKSITARVSELSKGCLNLDVGPLRCLALPNAYAAHAATLLDSVLYEDFSYSNAEELAAWLRRVQRAAFGARPDGAEVWWTNNYAGIGDSRFKTAGAADVVAGELFTLGAPGTAVVILIDSRLVDVEVTFPGGKKRLGAWPGGPKDCPGVRFTVYGLPPVPPAGVRRKE